VADDKKRQDEDIQQEEESGEKGGKSEVKDKKEMDTDEYYEE